MTRRAPMGCELIRKEVSASQDTPPISEYEFCLRHRTRPYKMGKANKEHPTAEKEMWVDSNCPERLCAASSG